MTIAEHLTKFLTSYGMTNPHPVILQIETKYKWDMTADWKIIPIKYHIAIYTHCLNRAIQNLQQQVDVYAGIASYASALQERFDS